MISALVLALGPLAAAAQNPPALPGEAFAVLERRVYITEIENEATRVVADGTAADILSGGADIAATGWAYLTGNGEEANPVMGGSKTNNLIFMGTKVTALAVTYFNRRKQMSAWKTCMIRKHDGLHPGACDQRRAVSRQTKLATIARLGIASWGAYVAARDRK